VVSLRQVRPAGQLELFEQIEPNPPLTLADEFVPLALLQPAKTSTASPTAASACLSFPETKRPIPECSNMDELLQSLPQQAARRANAAGIRARTTRLQHVAGVAAPRCCSCTLHPG
jgi:hypothetical protein